MKLVQVGTCDNLNKETMKISVVDKYRWSKIDDKQLFPVSNNGGNYDRCDSSISKEVNVSLLCLGKNIYEMSLLILPNKNMK